MRMLLDSILLASFFDAAFGGNLTHHMGRWPGEGDEQGSSDSFARSVLGLCFGPRDGYLFREVSMQLKLVAGNSAGTATVFYASNIKLYVLFVNIDRQDEINFKFLGNLSVDPPTVHTNVFVHGKGNKEQQFHLWFDPTKHFHTYTILWNPTNIIWPVVGTVIRVFKNSESIGVPCLQNKAMSMRVRSSLWNASDWATRGGLVKTDWLQAPFTASYRNSSAKACVWSSGTSSCSSGSPSLNREWMEKEIGSGLSDITWVQTTTMVYNYCSDVTFCRAFLQNA